MTTVTLTKSGDVYCVVAKGHATGRPDVCAGISTILQALDTWTQAEDGVTVLDRHVRSGDVLLKFCGAGSGTSFRLVAMGLKRLEATDPKTVKTVVSVKR